MTTSSANHLIWLMLRPIGWPIFVLLRLQILTTMALKRVGLRLLPHLIPVANGIYSVKILFVFITVVLLVLTSRNVRIIASFNCLLRNGSVIWYNLTQ